MIIVTGGAGFIGKHLVRRLEAEGKQVSIVDNYSRANDKDNLFEPLDVTKYSEIDSAFWDAGTISKEAINEVIHLAYINGTRHFYERPYEVMQVAVGGMLNVIQCCRDYKVKKFTLVSSSEVCRFKPMNTGEIIPLIIPDVYNPRYSYAAGKIMSEMMALHCGLFDKLTIVRPFNVYGPGMSLGHVVPDIIEQFKADDSREPIEIKLIGSGDETRSFCYIDDLIDGLMIARERGEHRGIYNIGNPQETSIRHLAGMIGAISGKNFILSFGDSWREGDLPRRRPDISKLAALGYEPKWTLWNGLSATMEHNNDDTSGIAGAKLATQQRG
jgi:nucleoside-diphosphate-sugar epimerase